MATPIAGELGFLSVSMIKKNPDWPYRKDMGYLKGLADSMDGPNGLLQPIGVDTAGFLLWGSRRLAAAVLLKWEKILCRIVDLDNPVIGIKDENENRSPLSPSEMTAILHAMEADERAKAKKRQEKSQFGAKNVNSQCSSGASKKDAPEEPGRTTEKIAGVLGVSKNTVEALKKIDANGTPELKEAVDNGDVSITGGGKLSEETPKAQTRTVEEIKKRKTGQKKPKVGSVLFDKNKFDGEWGQLLRQIDRIGNAYEAKESHEASGFRKRLEDWRKDVLSWEKKLREKK